MYFPNFIQKWNFQKIFLNFLIQNSQWFIRQFQSHIVEQNYCYHRYIFQISSSKNEIFKNLLNFLIQNIQQFILFILFNLGPRNSSYSVILHIFIYIYSPYILFKNWNFQKIFQISWSKTLNDSLFDNFNSKNINYLYCWTKLLHIK